MGPKFLFVATNARCNLHCKYCSFWKDQNPFNGMSIERRSSIIEEYAEFATADAAVVICGGEGLMDPKPYFAVARQCRDLGLRCLSVTNGTFITARVAERLVAEGPSEISVSLDHHQAAVHEAFRGGHAGAVQALRNLIAARGKARSPKIYAMAVVGEHNYLSLWQMYDFVLHDIGADKLKLNILQPTFGGGSSEDGFPERVVQDLDTLERLLLFCNREFGLNMNPKWLKAVLMYHQSVRDDPKARFGWGGTGTRDHICNSYDRNIMVDLEGTARLCYFPSFGSAQISRRGDLKRFWKTAPRDEMRKCNRYCGISHSVRKEHFTCG